MFEIMRDNYNFLSFFFFFYSFPSVFKSFHFLILLMNDCAILHAWHKKREQWERIVGKGGVKNIVAGEDNLGPSLFTNRIIGYNRECMNEEQRPG